MDNNIGGRMSKMDGNSFKEDSIETADEYYTAPQTKTDPSKLLVGSLVVQLNSRKTQLRNIVAELTSYKQKMNNLDLRTEKEMIVHQWNTAESKKLQEQQNEMLMQKEVLAKELKGVVKVKDCLEADLDQEIVDLQAQQKKNSELMKQEEELRCKLRAMQQDEQDISKYIVELQRVIEENDNAISAHKTERDTKAKKAITLQTFTKAFDKKIQGKEKELSQAQFQQKELSHAFTAKQLEKSKKEKEREEKEWECRQYAHHNKDIQDNNDKLKADLERLMKHLESVRRNNQQLGGCLKQYAETGVAAAKKILKQANK